MIKGDWGQHGSVARLAVHCYAVLLQSGGGNPLALVKRAATRVAEREVRRGGSYTRRFALLGSDGAHAGASDQGTASYRYAMAALTADFSLRRT